MKFLKVVITIMFIRGANFKVLSKVITDPQPIVAIDDYNLNIKIAEEGDGRAAGIIADCYLTGIGVKPDINKAWKWYAFGASKGDAESRYRLGYLYKVGNGVKQNNREAAYWFRSAAAKGHPIAMLYLADCYYEGIGVQRDYRIAAENFWRSADKGVAEAAYRLGLMLRDGTGVERDLSKSLRYLRQAAIAGFPGAQELVIEMERQGVTDSSTPKIRQKKSTVVKPASKTSSSKGSKSRTSSKKNSKRSRK